MIGSILPCLAFKSSLNLEGSGKTWATPCLGPGPSLEAAWLVPFAHKHGWHVHRQHCVHS